MLLKMAKRLLLETDKRLLWKLAWLTVFTVAKKSLTYWTDGFP